MLSCVFPASLVVPPLLLTIALLPVLAGCGSNPFNPPIDPGGDGHVPGDTPLNDSPQNLMLRFEKSYEFQDLPTYINLLTSDFRYTFSADSDPTLVNLYPNWGRDDEEESTKHLFEGFTNSETPPRLVPAASRIEMTLTGVQYQGDYQHPDSGFSLPEGGRDERRHGDRGPGPAVPPRPS
jgi:hypothetical protein